MKTCSKCKKLLPLESFDKKGHYGGKQRYRSDCKDCKASLDKSRISKLSKEARAKRTRQDYLSRQIRTTPKVEYVQKFLSEHPCVDCGESDILYLEFDHVRDSKILSVSSMIHRDFPLEIIITEIEKCEVRCVKCHRLVTAERANWPVLNSPYRFK